MKYMFFIIIFALLVASNAYIAWRFWQMVPPSASVLRIVLIAAIAVALCSVFLYFMVMKSAPLGIASALHTVGTSWLVITLYLFMILLVVDILRLVRVIEPAAIRANWTLFSVVCGLLVAVMTYGYITYLNKKRTVVDVPIAKSVPGVDRLKVVLLTDLHLGYGTSEKELAGWVDKVNAERADLVLIAGDLIDNDVRPLLARGTAAGLRRIESRLGVYMVYGNHEFIAGSTSSGDFIAQTGIHLLRDSVALVDGIYIVGRDDRSNPNRKSLAQLTSDLDKRRPIILMDHQPYDLPHAENAGIDLQVSGHTHRGQVWPMSWLTDSMYELSYGYKTRGDTHYYVSSGMGLWGGKFRIGTRSEYVVLDLTFDNTIKNVDFTL